jgi:hypothetical protein
VLDDAAPVANAHLVTGSNTSTDAMASMMWHPGAAAAEFFYSLTRVIWRLITSPRKKCE